MKKQIKSLYDAAQELCAYCKESAETDGPPEHACLAKPIYDAVDALAKSCERLDELERIDSINKALSIRLREVELERDRYFQQKQENGKLVGELRGKLQCIQQA